MLIRTNGDRFELETHPGRCWHLRAPGIGDVFMGYTTGRPVGAPWFDRWRRKEDPGTVFARIGDLSIVWDVPWCRQVDAVSTARD